MATLPLLFKEDNEMCEKKKIATFEEMKAEAVSRMKMLGIFQETVKQFEQDNQISQSEYPFGAYYWIGDKLKTKIREIETEYGGIVYSVIRAKTDIGLLDSCLWVSQHKDEWEKDREDIAYNIVFAYVINWDNDTCSEFGSIGVSMGCAGGLIRIS